MAASVAPSGGSIHVGARRPGDGLQKALNNASHFGVDDAIDPADSRWWVASLLRSIRPPAPREGKKRPAIDAW